MDPETELLRDYLDEQRNHVLGILEGLDAVRELIDGRPWIVL